MCSLAGSSIQLQGPGNDPFWQSKTIAIKLYINCSCYAWVPQPHILPLLEKCGNDHPLSYPGAAS